MFWGSSNLYPIRGKRLDRNKRFLPASDVVDTLFNKDMAKHGWERFGENNSDTVIPGYIEGPWLTKHNEKYYMQYGAPGTGSMFMLTEFMWLNIRWDLIRMLPTIPSASNRVVS